MDSQASASTNLEQQTSVESQASAANTTTVSSSESSQSIPPQNAAQQQRPKQETATTSNNSDQTPLSEWEQHLQRATQDPYSVTAWNTLVAFAEGSADLEKIKEAYEALLARFPNTSSAQIAYLNHFLTNPTSFPYAESLFARFLRTSPSVELWKFYITYVRRVNSGPATRDTVRKAYDFALNHVGQDKDSGDIWAEYIQFLKDGETTTTWEEQQKMDSLRRVYQRSVQIPLENVEVLWKDYEAFENNLNKITAKKFMVDLSPAHMTARTKLRELRKLLLALSASSSGAAGTTPNQNPPLDLPQKPSFSSADRVLAGAWKAYLKWEEGNPLELGEGNSATVGFGTSSSAGPSNAAVEKERERATFISRVQAVYRKAVAKMRFFAEIWFMGYSWLSSVGKQEDALTMLKSGIDANPSSLVLNFAYAEALELSAGSLTGDARKAAFADVHASYNRLLQAVQGELEETEKKVAAAAAAEAEDGGEGDDAALADFAETSLNGASAYTPAFDLNGRSASRIIKEDSGSTQVTSSSQSNLSEKAKAEKELKSLRQEYGLVYVLFIRFALRAEGIDASRTTFARARKDKWTPWEVFEAAALMEYHVAKQLGVANKILGLAHARFPDEIDFVVRYLQFLMSVNDENNARALFERAVANPKFTPDVARPLWEAWARYEYQYGNLEAAVKLEKRMAEAYPNDPPIKRFAQRHSYNKIDGIANRDLGFSVLRQQQQQSGLGRTDTLTSTLSPVTAGPGTSQATIPYLTGKRPSSPERPRRDESKPIGDHSGYGISHKRVRELSPPVRGDRDRDRWGGPGGRDRRYGSPAWERDHRDRERSPPPRRGGRGGDRDEPEKPILPHVLSWFVGQLPPASSFDGPVFRTDDLLQLFRNAVIPSGTRARSPPPPPRPSRPPPDYGPYQGPTGGRGGRRY